MFVQLGKTPARKPGATNILVAFCGKVRKGVRRIVEAGRGVLTQELRRIRLTKGVNFPAERPPSRACGLTKGDYFAQNHRQSNDRNPRISDLFAVERWRT
jgi:hypothetical protein